MSMVNKFRATFTKGVKSTAESITVKFELSLMSDASIQACAKLALGDKCNVNPNDYHLESITEV